MTDNANISQPKNNTKQIHSFSNDVLGTHDATCIAEKIANEEITALDAAKAAIARIKQVNPTLNAMAHECFVEGELDAQRYNQGIFSGVPTVVKDNIDIQSLPTQNGTKAFVATAAKKSDAISKQFLAQGFTLLGKSTLPEFGFNGTTEYMDGSSTKNPWHIDHSSGGSSGGSASLVAAGAVPMAHGNDGGGSIRIPASACGLVGLKASRGRMLMSKVAKSLPVKMISDGVLTRSVRDTANFMAGAEQYYHNPAFAPIGQVGTANKKRLTIALIKDSLTGKANDDATNATLEDTIKLLEQLGHTVVEKELTIAKDFIDGFLNYYGFLGFITAYGGSLSFGKSFNARKLEPLSLGLKEYYQDNYVGTPKAVKMYHVAKRIYKEYMQGIDIMLSPVTPFSAPKLGYLSPALPYHEVIPRLSHYASFTAIHNVLGTPAISLPLGFTQDGFNQDEVKNGAKRPLGMQFAATAGQEKMLLELAFELEAAQPFTHLYDV